MYPFYLFILSIYLSYLSYLFYLFFLFYLSIYLFIYHSVLSYSILLYSF